jgi:hypothetical protein
MTANQQYTNLPPSMDDLDDVDLPPLPIRKLFHKDFLFLSVLFKNSLSILFSTKQW